MASSPDHRDRHRRLAARMAASACAAVLALSMATACGDGDASDATDPSAQALEGVEREEPVVVGDLELPEVQPDGSVAPFRFRADDGGLLFVAFGYPNCPDVCPTTLYDISKARAQLGDDGERIEVAFVTIDPARDTADIVQAYLGSFAPTGGHPLRTSERDDQLAAAEEAFGVTSSVETAADGEIQVAHSAKSFVVDPDGRIVVEWAFGTSADAMASDLTILLDRLDA